MPSLQTPTSGGHAGILLHKTNLSTFGTRLRKNNFSSKPERSPILKTLFFNNMEKINIYFEVGLVTPAFRAQKNLLTWKEIANAKPKIDQFTYLEKKLLGEIQKWAQTTFVLYTSKLFDNPKKNFETRNIQSFLSLIETTEHLKINCEWSRLSALCEELKITSLCEAIVNENEIVFKTELVRFFREKYQNDELQNKIKNVKHMRDKYEAHNEHLVETFLLELDDVQSLLNYTYELITVFGMAYLNTKYKNRNVKFFYKSAQNEQDYLSPLLSKIR